MKSTRTTRIAILIAAAMLLGCAAAKKFHALNEGQKDHNPADYGYKPAQHIKRDIVYAPGLKGEDRLTLDAHWNDSDTPKPMAVVIHGGGWFMGSKEAPNENRISDYLADHGYVAINVNYRMIPFAKVEDCIEDTFGAIVWAKEHAAEFGGDPERFGATGFSAGGHLAAMVATAGMKRDVFPATGHESSKFDASVKVAVPFYGVYNVLTLPPDIFPVPMFLNKTFFKFVYNGKPDENREYGIKISPVTYIDDRTPPQYIVCGDADSLKLYPQSLEYVDALKKANRVVEFMSVPGADHSFNVQYWTPESVAAHKAIIDYFDKYLK